MVPLERPSPGTPAPFKAAVRQKLSRRADPRQRDVVDPILPGAAQRDLQEIIAAVAPGRRSGAPRTGRARRTPVAGRVVLSEGIAQLQRWPLAVRGRGPREGVVELDAIHDGAGGIDQDQILAVVPTGFPRSA